MKGKKGISPLIATVLLIAFAVALGAIVMNWGARYVGEMNEDVEDTANRLMACNNVQLSVKKFGSEKQICYDSSSGNVTFILENTGLHDIYGIQVRVWGATKNANLTNMWNVTIPEGYPTGLLSVRYDPVPLGNVTQVEFVPRLRGSGTSEPALCSNYRLEEAEVYPC